MKTSESGARTQVIGAQCVTLPLDEDSEVRIPVPQPKHERRERVTKVLLFVIISLLYYHFLLLYA